jgi:hypothetical protein
MVPVIKDNIWKPDLVAGYEDLGYPVEFCGVPGQQLIIPLLRYSGRMATGSRVFRRYTGNEELSLIFNEKIDLN